MIRRLTSHDVPTAEQISGDAFHALDLATTPPGAPAPPRRTPDHAAAWIARTRRLVETDGEGCWAAESGDEMIGFATSLRREQVWCLATFAVRPGLQGHGVGARLLEAAGAH